MDYSVNKASAHREHKRAVAPIHHIYLPPTAQIIDRSSHFNLFLSRNYCCYLGVLLIYVVTFGN